MSKIQEVLFKIYEKEISECIVEECFDSGISLDDLSEEYLNEIVGTMLGIMAGKAIAPVVAGVGSKFLGVAGASKLATIAGVGIKGAKLTALAAKAPILGGIIGGATDVVAGSVLSKGIKNITQGIKDKKLAKSEEENFKKNAKEFKIKYEDKDGNWQYRVTKGYDIKDAIKRFAVSNRLRSIDIEPNE